MHNPKKRIEKLRYLHRNPVGRGLVEKPEDWEWSSFRHYAIGMEGVVEIESEWTGRRRERMGMPLRVKVRNPEPSRFHGGDVFALNSLSEHVLSNDLMDKSPNVSTARSSNSAAFSDRTTGLDFECASAAEWRIRERE